VARGARLGRLCVGKLQESGGCSGPSTNAEMEWENAPKRRSRTINLCIGSLWLCVERAGA